MTRIEFIKKIETIGFMQKLDSFYKHEGLLYPICLCSNKDWFTYGVDGYTFDEFDQFLIDKDIK